MSLKVKKSNIFFGSVNFRSIFTTSNNTDMTTKITNGAQLAWKLADGGVSVSLIGKNLDKRVSLWLSRKEVYIENGVLKLSK
jgi:hypothetical protein